MAENQTYSVGYGDDKRKCNKCKSTISSNTLMGTKVGKTSKFELFKLVSEIVFACLNSITKREFLLN